MRIKAIDKQTNNVVYIVQILSPTVCAYIEQDGTRLQFCNPIFLKIDDDAYKTKKGE